MQVSLNPFSLIGIFFAGVLVSFSPCIYPLLPLSLSVIGAKGAESRLKGFLLSLVYSFGLALAFSILGSLAALGGKIFKPFSQSPYFYLAIANIYLLLALSLLGVIGLPQSSNSFITKISRRFPKQGSLLGIFVLGLGSGLIISPCATPVLGAILTYITSQGSLFSGIILLSTFALGMSSLLILAGTFSGLLYYLPKAGIWNERLKKIGAFILLIGAEYFFLRAGFLL